MAKLKITQSYNGTAVDAYISPTLISGNHVGGTGGDTGQTVPTITAKVKVGSNSAADGFIIAQKGIRKFRVQDASTNKGTCKLVNKASGSLAANEMSILVTKEDASTFYASRITNKFVWDFSGNRYRYWLSAATSTFVQVASA